MGGSAQDEAALIPYQPGNRHVGMIMPLVDAKAAQLAIKAYEELKAAIARPEDIYKKGDKSFLKKSFWRRLASCFGVSLELAREEYLVDELTGVYGYSVSYRAIAPSGQSVEGDGLCTSDEKRDKKGNVVETTRHIVRATAHTRAKNRAISDLVGGGEVSAEEVDFDYEVDGRTVESTPPAPRRGQHENKPQQKGPDWPTLRKKLFDEGVIESQDRWGDLLCDVTGKTDVRLDNLTVADYNAVVKRATQLVTEKRQQQQQEQQEQQEQQQQEEQLVEADFTDALDEYDLSKLPTGSRS